MLLLLLLLFVLLLLDVSSICSRRDSREGGEGGIRRRAQSNKGRGPALWSSPWLSLLVAVGLGTASGCFCIDYSLRKPVTCRSLWWCWCCAAAAIVRL